jgi:Trk K+ transport system NAD-binding subunit
VFERRPRGGFKDDGQAPAGRYDALVFGLGRYGARLADELRGAGLAVLGVDFDPDTVRRARAGGRDSVFGDASDPEFVSQLPLHGVRWAVCTVPEHDLGVTHEDPRLALLRSLRGLGFEGRIAIAAHRDAVAARLEAAGADLVLQPYRDAAAHGADRVLGRDGPRPATGLESASPARREATG